MPKWQYSYHILPLLYESLERKKCRKTQISEGTVPQDFQHFFFKFNLALFEQAKTVAQKTNLHV